MDTDESTIQAMPAPAADRPLGLEATVADSSAGTSRAADRDAIAAGARIERFVVEQRLGAGAMGVVYAAHDPELDRRVAIKLIRTEAAGQELRARMYREAQALAQVAHPNVVVVHEVGAHGDQVYVAMELVRGKTLREWLAVRRTTDEILRVLIQIGRGLAAVHAAKLIHRDFKPDNVLISDDGRARVTDFGLARPGPGASGDSEPAPASDRPGIPHAPLAASLTATGALIGTPAYMAPEQIDCQPVTQASDQFSFCVTAYEALYGARPFDAATLGELHAQILAGRIATPPRARRVSGRIRRALLRGLRPSPAERHPSMEALVATLVAARARPRWIAVGAGVLVAAGAASVALALTARDRVDPTCVDEGLAIARQWNPAAAAALQNKLTSSGAPYADKIAAGLTTTYTRYAEAWTAMRTSACTARRDGDALAERTIACLDARRKGLTANLAFAMAPEAAPHQIPLMASYLLEPIATCAHPADDHGTFDETQRARQAMRTAEAAWLSGRYEEAQRQLEDLFQQLEPLHYPPIQVEVLLTAVGVALGTQDVVRQEALARRALALAEAAGDDRIKLKAAAMLASSLASGGRADAAEQVLELADATLARVGVDLGLEAWLANARGEIAKARAAWADAARLFEHALELSAAVDDLPRVLPYRQLSEVYVRLGRTADAQAIDARYAASTSPPPGRRGASSTDPRPPGGASAAASLLTACRSANDAGDLDRALAQCTEAVATLERENGVDALIVAPAHKELGEVLSSRNERTRARAEFLAAARILDANHVLDKLAEAYERAALESMLLGDARSAVEQSRRCVKVAGELGKAGEDQLVKARVALGRALGAAHQAAAAIAELDWAIPRLEVRDTDDARVRLPRARLGLADALWQRARAGDRARARVVIATARDEARGLRASLDDSDPAARQLAVPAAEARIQEIERWQSTHR